MNKSYYVVKNRPSIAEPIRIGRDFQDKLFCFTTRNQAWHIPPITWNTFNQIKQWLKKYTVDSDEWIIIDDDDNPLSYDEFVALVEAGQSDAARAGNKDNFYKCRNVDGYRFDDDIWG